MITLDLSILKHFQAKEFSNFYHINGTLESLPTMVSTAHNPVKIVLISKHRLDSKDKLLNHHILSMSEKENPLLMHKAKTKSIDSQLTVIRSLIWFLYHFPPNPKNAISFQLPQQNITVFQLVMMMIHGLSIW